MLDLIDQSRSPQAGDEARGIVDRRIPRVVIVKGQGRHGVVPSDDVASQRRLADLAGAGNKDDPRIGERLQDQRSCVALVHAVHHNGASVRRWL